MNRKQFDKNFLGKTGKDLISLLNKDKAPVSSAEFVAPRNSREQDLIVIWEVVLGRTGIGVKDDFFKLGGNSIKATQLVSRIARNFSVNVKLTDVFSHATLEEQSILIEQSTNVAYNEIPLAEKQDSYPLSSSQRRLWVLSQFEAGNVAYNMPGVYVFEGSLNRTALEEAFQELIIRHEMLQTVFKEDESGEPRQFIQPTAFHIPHHDLQEGTAKEVSDLVESLFRKPFNLSEGPLVRAELIQTKKEKYVFVYVMHHIISDGWSMEVLIRELLTFYNSHVGGTPFLPAPLRIHYKDYAVWQQLQLNGEKLTVHKEYWLKKFEGEIPQLALASDRPRPKIKTYNGGTVRKAFAKELTAGLKLLSKEKESTLFMGLLASVNALLYKYTNQQDIVVGSPAAGREHLDLEEQIGFYINTLALRTSFDPEGSFNDLLDKVKEVTLEAYTHQVFPFDELVDELHLHRDMSRSALFDVMVVLLNTNEVNKEIKGLKDIQVSSYRDINVRSLSKFDLTFTFAEVGEGLHLTMTYNSDLYNRDTIERLVNHLEMLLNVIVLNSTVALNRIDYLTEAEKIQLLEKFNSKRTLDYSREKTLVTLFEEQVEKTPDAEAIVFEKNSLSYRQLNEKSNQLAHRLRVKYKVIGDDLIGIQLPRSESMVVAILGVLKSGGAYVPIDPGYPKERMDYMVSDSGCKVLIDEAEWIAFKNSESEYSVGNLFHINKEEDLAYVIYTSGSTGQPKGVKVTRKSLAQYICSIASRYDLGTEEKILQVSNISFDASVEQIFLSVLSGAALYVADEATVKDPTLLKSFIRDNAITHVHSVPALLEHMDLANQKSLRRIVSAGDRCAGWLYEGLGTAVSFYNKYGPTEVTISSCIYKIDKSITDPFNVPIGSPIGNAQIYIVNNAHQLQGIGIAGEICIGGSGLAQGYLNNDELTGQKFIANPFKEGERIYKTGDLGRWLPDGNIEFIGRMDDQIKLRGYRIELGEIESVLRQHESISEVVVLSKSLRTEKVLVAYVVGKKIVTSSDLRQHLIKTLPAYMIPSHYVQRESLPLTSNGKIDKKKLLQEDIAGMAIGTVYTAPCNEMEENLVEIWEELLDRKKIGTKDDFFDLGGHSLKATRLSSQIYKKTGVKIPLNEIFENRTIEAQASFINKIIWLKTDVQMDNELII